jgi:hypothetical protein
LERIMIIVTGAATDPTLAALLGREPTTMAAVLRAELSGD